MPIHHFYISKCPPKLISEDVLTNLGRQWQPWCERYSHTDASAFKASSDTDASACTDATAREGSVCAIASALNMDLRYRELCHICNFGIFYR